MRWPTLLFLAVSAFLACVSQTPSVEQRAEANRFCTQQCDGELGEEDFFSCDVVCGCMVDALAELHSDQDVAALIVMLDADERTSSPELEQAVKDCGLKSTVLPESALDLSSAGWYSAHLTAAGESRIESTGRENVEVYRLLVLPSFTSTIVVRVERVGERITYTTKRLSGAGGYEPGEIECQAEGKVSNADWTEFKRLLLAGDFWSQLSQDVLDQLRRERCEQGDDSACWVGADGTTFVLEGADRSRYEVVDRWEEFEPPLASAVELLLSISPCSVVAGLSGIDLIGHLGWEGKPRKRSPPWPTR